MIEKMCVKEEVLAGIFCVKEKIKMRGDNVCKYFICLCVDVYSCVVMMEGNHPKHRL